MILQSSVFLESNSLNLDWLCKSNENLEALILEQEELIYSEVFDDAVPYGDILPEDIEDLQNVLKYYAYQKFAISLRNEHYSSQLIEAGNVNYTEPKIINEKLFADNLKLASLNFYTEVNKFNNEKFTIKDIYYGK